MNLLVLGTSYKWKHTILIFCVLLFLLGVMFSRFIHTVYVSVLHCFLWLNVPLCGYATIHLSIYPLMDIWVVRTFWLWSFVYNLLFDFLFSILLGICLGMELLAYMVILYLTFWGTQNCFPQQQNHFIFLPAMCKGSNFSKSSSTIVLFLCLKKKNHTHPSKCVGISHCGFDFHFTNN